MTIQNLTAPAPSPGPAAGGRELDAMRDVAEEYMVEVLGLTPRLLPSALESHPLHGLSVALRNATVRRARLVHRLHIAAVNLHQQIGWLAAATSRGSVPSAGTALNADDLSAVTALPAQILELDMHLVGQASALTLTALEVDPTHGVPRE